MPPLKDSASADTCVVSDFLATSRLDLLGGLFPQGLWIDPSVLQELSVQFGESVLDDLRSQGCVVLIERGFGPDDYLEMAEIKRRRPALLHPDVVSVVLARMHDATCLSSDGAVRKTCQERGIDVAGHVGCLRQGMVRGLLSHRQASDLLDRMLERGLYLPASVVDDFRASR